MKLSENDIQILRELACRYAEIASLPEQQTRRERWFRHNALESGRPLILLDQLPWNEFNADCLLNRRVENDTFAPIEQFLRRTIFQWTHFAADMVVDPYIKVSYPFHNTGWGLSAKVTRLKMDATSDVAAQSMENLIQEPEDIEKIRFPEISVDAEEVRSLSEAANYVFGGILPWKFTGEILHLGAWDTIAYWMGVQNCYIELMDRPEMMHALMEKLTNGYLHEIEQMNRLKLFDTNGHLCHCSHTYRRDDAPDRENVSQNSWAFGMAQLFSSVSPAITEAFECVYMRRIFPKLGHIYYGCCEKLDDRLEIVSKLPNVRKISCSPWNDPDVFAEKLPPTIIMSNKPNPALLAWDTFDETAVRMHLRRTMDAAKRNGRTLELILKDVSTVRYDPARLTRFAEIAREEAER